MRVDSSSMQFPRRSMRSIPALPSIFTSFPEDSSPSSRSTSANDSASTCVEDGIELVPIERSNTTCGKILSPGTEEKEAIFSAKVPYALSKQLPDLPKNRWTRHPRSSWHRLSVKYRIFVLFAVQISILLVVMGCLVSVKKRKRFSPEVSVQSENSPMVPSIPIKQGTFAIALGNVRQQSSACLSRSNESAAWACDSNDILQMDITSPTIKNASQKLISIRPPVDAAISYGQQALEIESAILTPTEDPDYPKNGLAYYFQTTYNRTVLVTDEQLTTPDADTNRKSSSLKKGDQPWLCFFNETIVEGYIYVSQRSMSTNKTSTITVSTTSSNFSTVISAAKYLPYTLKLSEKRVSNSTIPYCERQTVSDDGKLVANRGAKFMLGLSGPAFVLNRVEKRWNVRRGDNMGRRDDEKACQCQWMVQ